LTYLCELPVQHYRVPAVRCEQTLRAPILFSGNGLFTDQEVEVKISPASEGHGIIFERSDLPSKPQIPATLEYVQGTNRCTTLGSGRVVIHTVEHLLAALKAADINNALIEISGSEVPILDGSALPFCEMVKKAGIQQQKSKKPIVKLSTPCYWSHGDTHIVALPSDELRISYTLHYPSSKLLGSQYYSAIVTEDLFLHELAPARTFCLYEEAAQMKEKGLLKGAGLENGVLIKDDVVLNPEGLRFSDEMVRHKVLDLIGDLSLIGTPFIAHLIAVRSGHTANHAFAKELAALLARELEA
jgi:UDP-3-O-[3-hydroxymyristoyl] N-acetylglucosamine deacetylase